MAIFDTKKLPVVVPFGKYKGQVAEELRGNPEFTEWLEWARTQSWFAQRYAEFNTYIINNYGAPALAVLCDYPLWG
jgi:hypothetical protein